MRLADVAMVAADTSRSRAYLQAMVRNDLLPNHVLVLGSRAGKPLPGQVDGSAAAGPIAVPDEPGDCWSEAHFDARQPIQDTLEQSRIGYEVIAEESINDPAVIAAIGNRPETVFVYSGYGGVLLRKEVLGCGKRFLHVHGGYLPDYKGSTANYFSLIEDGTIGASSLFLSAELDSGPVLLRKKFPPPRNREKIDHVYDPAARAKVLVETLANYARHGSWDVKSTESGKGETYFIIHPVLKHIAILSKKEASSCE